jgi:hypothetical protein
MIVNGSRYLGQPLVSVPTDDQGDSATAVFGSIGLPPVIFVYYTVLAGDRFDIISNRLYGIPDNWWRIANANPEIFYPDDLVVGSIIRVPAQ